MITYMESPHMQLLLGSQPVGLVSMSKHIATQKKLFWLWDNSAYNAVFCFKFRPSEKLQWWLLVTMEFVLEFVPSCTDSIVTRIRNHHCNFPIGRIMKWRTLALDAECVSVFFFAELSKICYITKLIQFPELLSPVSFFPQHRQKPLPAPSGTLMS